MRRSGRCARRVGTLRDVGEGPSILARSGVSTQGYWNAAWSRCVAEKTATRRSRQWFIGDPAAAKEIGLSDQYMGWTGVVSRDELTDIHVEETRRV
jgi:hypothetical protein